MSGKKQEHDNESACVDEEPKKKQPNLLKDEEDQANLNVQNTREKAELNPSAIQARTKH